MKTLVIYLFFGCVFFYAANCDFLKKGETFKVEMVDTGICASGENEIQFYPKVQKYNRTSTGFSITVNLSEPFDDSYVIEAELQAWKDGGWKQNFLKAKRQGACSSAFLFLGGVFKKMMIAAKIPPRCPVAPGYYSFANQSFVLNNIPFMVQEGQFRGIIHLFKHKQTRLCYFFDMNCIRVYGV